MAGATPNKGLYGEPCVQGYTVLIYDRGGLTRYNEIVDVATISWGRLLQGKTQAIVTITGKSCLAQISVLRGIKSRRHEMRILRGSSVVWEGPIVQAMGTAAQFTITANDILEYIEGTSLTVDWPGPGVPVTRQNLILNPSGQRGITGYVATSTNLGSTSGGGLTAAATAAATVAATIGVAIGTYTVGTAAGNLLPNTTYTFSAMMGAAVGQAPWQLSALGAGLAAVVNGSALTVDSQYHSAYITFTTGASGTVTVGFTNNGAVAIGNFFSGYDFQLELGTGASTYFDGSFQSTGAETFGWTGAADASASTTSTLVGPPGMTDRIKAILNYELTTAYEMTTSSGTTVVGRWEQESPPANVLPYVEITSGPTQTTVSTTAFQMSVGQHLYNLGGSIGVAFTTVGRMLRIWDGFLSQTRTLTEKDVSGDFQVIEAGGDFYTVEHVVSSTLQSNGDPVVGHAQATDPNTGEADTYYGPWETIVSTTTTNADGSAITPAELNSQANTGLAGNYPVPWELITPQGAILIPSAGLDINDLVCGVNIPVNAAHNIKPMNQMQMLTVLQATIDASGEKIAVTLAAAQTLQEA